MKSSVFGRWWAILERCSQWGGRISILLLVAAIVFSPFVSDLDWSWSALALFVALSWFFALPKFCTSENTITSMLRFSAVPALAFVFVLLWVWLQTVPWVPPDWQNGAWSVLGDAKIAGSGFVSLAPYRTETELMKLLATVAGGVLAYFWAAETGVAKLLSTSIVVTGIIQGIYALLLHALPCDALYLLASINPEMIGAITGHGNSRVIVVGMALLIVVATATQYSFDRVAQRDSSDTHFEILNSPVGIQAPLLASLLVLILAVAFEGTREDLRGAFAGCLAIFCFAGFASIYGLTGRRPLMVCLIAMAAFTLLVGADIATADGDFWHAKESRDPPPESRTAVWEAGTRVVEANPIFGVGLGAFRDAYSLYGDRPFPFTIDRTNSDYLDFALGVGLPASTIWWLGLLFMTVRCAVGAMVRKNHQQYALAGVGAVVFIAFLSASDFPLQVPAIALLFAITLGIAYAQAFPAPRKIAIHRLDLGAG